MSKLKDNQKLECAECHNYMDSDNITFCNVVMQWSNKDNKPIERRCAQIICPDCEFCRNCKEQIDTQKLRMRSVRSNKIEYNQTKDFLLRCFGVEYNLM